MKPLFVWLLSVKIDRYCQIAIIIAHRATTGIVTDSVAGFVHFTIRSILLLASGVVFEAMRVNKGL